MKTQRESLSRRSCDLSVASPTRLPCYTRDPVQMLSKTSVYQITVAGERESYVLFLKTLDKLLMVSSCSYHKCSPEFC